VSFCAAISANNSVSKGPNKALSEAAKACASVLAYKLAAAFPSAVVLSA